MATLRFKSDGTPFVDFRCQGKRFRPEFLSTRDAQKFVVLADANPVEAYRFWQESIADDGPMLAASESISLKSKIAAFKADYCAKRSSSTDMKRTIDQFFEFVIERAQKTTGRKVDDVDVKALDLEDYAGFQSHLATKLENASVNRYFSTIKTFSSRMLKARYALVDFASLVDTLEVKSEQREPWQAEDTLKLIVQLTESGSDPILVEVAQSMDVSPFGPIDFARLKWRMIDFEVGQINTYRLKGRGRRDWHVPLLLSYQRILLEIRKRHEAAGYGKPNDHVYLDRQYRPLRPGWVSTCFRRARVDAGIEHVPYTSRHKILNDVAAKTDRDTAAKFAGHASVKTTEKYYLGARNEDFNKRVKEALGQG